MWIFSCMYEKDSFVFVEIKGKYKIRFSNEDDDDQQEILCM